MSREQQVGRLALRQEGTWWKAYYAMPGTMKGALLLGTIRRKHVEGGVHSERGRQFMNFMQQCVSDIIEETFGQRPSWPEGPQPAPENERGQRP